MINLKESGRGTESFDTKLATILGYVRKQHGDRLRARPVDLQRAFYVLKQRYSSELCELNFNESFIVPYCGVLDYALGRLQITHSLRRINPSWKEFEIRIGEPEEENPTYEQIAQDLIRELDL